VVKFVLPVETKKTAFFSEVVEIQGTVLPPFQRPCCAQQPKPPYASGRLIIKFSETKRLSASRKISRKNI